MKISPRNPHNQTINNPHSGAREISITVDDGCYKSTTVKFYFKDSVAVDYDHDHLFREFVEGDND